MPQLSAPTVGDVAAIAALPDPTARNHRITRCYHELSLALRAHTGPGANWCSFATWASRQAGRTIRREDLRAALHARLCDAPEVQALAARLPAALAGDTLASRVATVVDALLTALERARAFDRAGEAVAAGNLKVFEEIGAEFARFLEALAADDAAALDAFIAALRPGEPPEGQQLLRDAFGAYREALATPLAAARAQLLFYANLLVGLHEQTRLQPEIRAALDAGMDVDAVRRGVVACLLPGFWRRLRYRLAALLGRRPPLDEIIDGLGTHARRELRAAITAHAMTLELAGGEVLRLGRDLRGAYATSLAALAEPRLAALVARIDPAPDTGAGSGAADWSVLEQRMHLICELFRTRHEWEGLYAEP